MMAGVKMIHVPYKGATPALVDVLGGHIEVYFGSIVPAMPHVKSGRLRPLGVTSMKRVAVVADLPTLDELGIHGAQIGGWYGLYAAAKSPKANTDRVRDQVLKALKEPDVREKINNLGAEPKIGRAHV